MAAYNASLETTMARPVGVNGMPDGARTYFHDTANFKYRPFVDIAEVLATLVTAANRKGHYLIIVNTGGTLLNGVITGGTHAAWWFKDGQADSDLVLFAGSESTAKETMMLEFEVGDGTANTPVDGSTTFTNSLFIGKTILDFNIEGAVIPGKVRTSKIYGTLNTGTGVYTLVNGVFSDGDYIKILYK